MKNALDFLWSYRFEQIYEPVLLDLLRDVPNKQRRYDDTGGIENLENLELLRTGRVIQMESSQVNDYALYIHLEDFDGFLDSRRSSTFKSK